jgi:alpha-tubulin suppressor-like RCC1 family protein
MRKALLTAVVVVLFPASMASANVGRWGSYYGGDTFPQPTPTVEPGLENVVSIDAGNASDYVLEGNGTVWAWGNGEYGALGNGSGADTVLPSKVQFPAGVRIVSIGEARDNGYAIDSTGQGWAWGLGESGSLCLGAVKKKQRNPVKVPGITSAVQVQGGQNHVLWLLADGSVKTCGTNSNGQLGVGENVSETSVPLAVQGLEHVVEVSASVLSSAARTESGAIYTWGDNESGQAGIGSEEENVYLPALVPLPGPASEVSCGGDAIGLGSRTGFMLAIVEGQVFGWGNDQSAQIGDQGKGIKSSPVATGLHFAKVVASGANSVGLTAGGGVYTWGAPTGFALGNLGNRRQLTPVEVDAGASMISATAENTLVG